MSVTASPIVKFKVAVFGVVPWSIKLRPAENHGQIYIRYDKHNYGPFRVADFDAAFGEIHRERQIKGVIPAATVPHVQSRYASTLDRQDCEVGAAKRPGFQTIKFKKGWMTVHPGKLIAAMRKANGLRFDND